MEELVERYLKHLTRTGFARRTIESYAANLRDFLGHVEAIGVHGPGELTREVVADYQAALFTATTARGRPLALPSQRHRLQTVIGFVRYLVAQGLILLNPAQGLEVPRRDPPHAPRHVPTEAEVEALLAAPDTSTLLGMRDRAILEVLYSTGLRVQELIELKLYDLNLPGGRLHVIAGKGGRDRVVPLGRMACEAVRGYLDRGRGRLLGGGRSPLLFVSVRGRKLFRSAVRLMIVGYCREAGLARGYSPHKLRHACATHMLRGRASIRHIQELLGHRQLSTTQVYTQVAIEDLKEVHRRTHPREKQEEAVKEEGQGGSTDPRSRG